ncbi:hypothetical protein C8R44DRAFT_867020 [Mycena epipterygia]|nr:hypothetical protein C8R44DRAFT_867020 [Mycena epipterygia]
MLVASAVRLPYGTLGDLYTSINVQIAGVYAPAVLLLVSNYSSFNETNFLGTIPPVGSEPPIEFPASRGCNRTMLSTMYFEIGSGRRRNDKKIPPPIQRPMGSSQPSTQSANSNLDRVF